jgi:outer membrane receptor protein involved in Fe transport
MARHLVIIICTFLLVVSTVARGASREEQELLMLYGGEEMVSIATGRSQPVNTAPAIATVITDKEIEKMGARDLDEVLETVPGLHVIPDAAGYRPNYVIRGVYSEYNPQVLMMVNGIPITHLFNGNRGQAWAGMPVQNIARVEIIRGPGSAVYGADAVAGTINIITKTANDIDGIEAGVTYGDYNSQQGWFLGGTQMSNWDVALAVQLQRTDGQDSIIDQDAQSGFDILLGTSASLAPGPVNLGRELIDVRLDLSNGPWQIRAGYLSGRNGETGAGAAQALDPTGRAESDRLNADITYKTNPSPEWDLATQFSYLQTDTDTNLVLYPPTADFGFGPFPEGVIGHPIVREHQGRFDFSAFYLGFKEHELRLGAGILYGNMYDVEEDRNYVLVPIAPGISLPAPLPGGVQPVPEDQLFIRPEDRTDIYTFVQDEWGFAPDWTLTAGLRYDHFSDFGSTLNPRLALVWQSGFNWTTKFLYGGAFRPPSFAELYNQNNPIALGNSELNPETINTVEIGTTYHDRDRFRIGANVFYYLWEDIIRFTPDIATPTATAQNVADQEGYGLELEFLWKAARSLELVGNYAYQHSEDQETGEDSGMAPEHQLYARLDWTMIPGWSLHPQANYVADRARQSGDTRPPVDNYTWVDLTLRYRPNIKGLNVAFSVRNMTDEDAREPSPAPGLIPNDLPLAGRNYYGELSYRW